MSLLGNRFTAVVAGAAVIATVGATGAVAADMITSADIQDDTIHTSDIQDGRVGYVDLGVGPMMAIKKAENAAEDMPGLKGDVDGLKGDVDGLKGDATGLEGRVSELESAAPDFAAPEVDGPYFDLAVSEDVQTFTAECSTTGKVALGGGFSVDFPQHRKNVQVVGSQPSIEGFTEIPGDPEGSIISHGWEIHVVNTGDVPTSIRPWVVCATVN